VGACTKQGRRCGSITASVRPTQPHIVFMHDENTAASAPQCWPTTTRSALHTRIVPLLIVLHLRPCKLLACTVMLYAHVGLISASVVVADKVILVGTACALQRCACGSCCMVMLYAPSTNLIPKPTIRLQTHRAASVLLHAVPPDRGAAISRRRKQQLPQPLAPHKPSSRPSGGGYLEPGTNDGWTWDEDAGQSAATVSVLRAAARGIQ
jgi:hypothetical protein